MGVPAGSAKLPRGRHHGRPGALHRHGADLESTSRRRPGTLRRDRGPELDPADPSLRTAGHALPRSLVPRRRFGVLARRQVRPHLSRRPPRPRRDPPLLPHPHLLPLLARQEVPPVLWPRGPARPRLHGHRALCLPGPADRLADRRGGADRRPHAHLLLPHVGRFVCHRVVHLRALRLRRHAGLHRLVQQLRARDRGRREHVRVPVRAGARGHRGAADRGAGPAGARVRGEVGEDQVVRGQGQVAVRVGEGQGARAPQGV